MRKTEAKKNELYCGADLHGNNVFLGLKDAEGKNVFRRRAKANLESINEALEPYWDRIKMVAVESTYNWYWFVDGLQAQGRNVKLANTARMEQYEGLKDTDDETDAFWLAEQLRLGILPESYIYPKEVRPIRDALRRRMLIVRQRTQTLLSLMSLLERHGLKAPRADQLKQWTAQEAEALELEKFTLLQAECLRKLLQEQDALAQHIEQEVLSEVKPTKDFSVVQVVPGIGPILGMVVLLESGTFQRFRSSGNYASYCRTVKSQRRSNKKKKGENNRKNGNPYLAWAFIEAASHAVRHYPKIKAWYERKKHRRNAPVAMKALACKLSKAVWHVMNGEEYDEKMLFG